MISYHILDGIGPTIVPSRRRAVIWIVSQSSSFIGAVVKQRSVGQSRASLQNRVRGRKKADSIQSGTVTIPCRPVKDERLSHTSRAENDSKINTGLRYLSDECTRV